MGSGVLKQGAAPFDVTLDKWQQQPVIPAGEQAGGRERSDLSLNHSRTTAFQRGGAGGGGGKGGESEPTAKPLVRTGGRPSA